MGYALLLSLNITTCDQSCQMSIARHILAKQNNIGGFLVTNRLQDPGFDADDRFYPPPLGMIIKFNQGEKISKLRYCYGWDILGGQCFHQWFYSQQAINKRKFCMKMQMYKIILHILEFFAFHGLQHVLYRGKGSPVDITYAQLLKCTKMFLCGIPFVPRKSITRIDSIII